MEKLSSQEQKKLALVLRLILILILMIHYRCFSFNPIKSLSEGHRLIRPYKGESRLFPMQIKWDLSLCKGVSLHYPTNLTRPEINQAGLAFSAVVQREICEYNTINIFNNFNTQKSRPWDWNQMLGTKSQFLKVVMLLN